MVQRFFSNQERILKKLKQFKMKNSEKIQELQMLEQTSQNLIFQKQAFQMELSEVQLTLDELEKSSDDVFKIIGQLLIKTEKQKVKKDLSEKQKIIKIRLQSIDKQEASLKENMENIRKEIISSKK